MWQSHPIFGISPDELSACSGCAAKYRSAYAISVYPDVRKRLVTAFRNAHITCGILPQRTCEASSPNNISREQCAKLSIAQCPRRSVKSRAAEPSSGGKLLIPYCIQCVVFLCGYACVRISIDKLVQVPAIPHNLYL